MNKRTWLIGLAALVLISGCPESNRDGGGTIPVRTDLIGTWSNTDGDGTSTVEFRSDGTLTMSWTEADETDSEVGSWSLDGRDLSIYIEESETEGEYSYSSSMTETLPIAIINGVLYVEVSVRAASSGNGVDGTWRYSYSGEEVYAESDPEESWEGRTAVEVIASVMINGDQFEGNTTWQEFEEEDGETIYDETHSFTSRGTVRLDGDAVYITTTESNGQAIPEEEQEEYLMGWKVAGDILVQSPDYEDGDMPSSPEETGFHRQ